MSTATLNPIQLECYLPTTADCLAPTQCVCFEPTVWPNTCCSLHRILRVVGMDKTYLIELVRDMRPLWDQRDINYHNRDLKPKVWDEIGEKLYVAGNDSWLMTNVTHNFLCIYLNTRVGTLIVATICLQLIQNRYMFRSFTILQCSHQHCVQPVASDVEVVG